jgi:hypothetical protein
MHDKGGQKQNESDPKTFDQKQNESDPKTPSFPWGKIMVMVPIILWALQFSGHTILIKIHSKIFYFFIDIGGIRVTLHAG